MLTIRSLSLSLLQHIAGIFSLPLPEVLASGAQINLLDPQSPHEGDLTTNAAMTLARLLKQPPRAIAERIAKSLEGYALHPEQPIIKCCEIAGPGFINLTLTSQTWAHIAGEITANPAEFFKAEAASSTPRSHLIEYVSANPTGPLHLGHGRNAIIGDVLARALRFSGNRVQTEFYINDAGSQMQKLGASLKARCQQELGTAAIIPEEGYHGQYLVEIARECLEKYGNQVVAQDNAFFTQYAKQTLLAQQKQELADYGVVLDTWFSETTLHENGAIDSALADLQQRGFLYGEDGALWFRSTAFGDDKDRVLRKQDGSLTYIAPDIAYHVDKFARGFEKLINIVGQDHHGYVLRLKGTLSALGYDASRLDVILYQLVSLKQGEMPVRMSKRSGTFIGLREVIDTVGVDAARFFFLHKKADAHLELDIDAALKQSQENPIFYLHYAYVRTLSIAQKATREGFAAAIISADTVFTKEELAVIKKTLGLGTAIAAVATQYTTHTLAQYALDLAHTFHSFYTSCRVIDATDTATTRRRLAIVALAGATLGISLDLLGLSRREHM